MCFTIDLSSAKQKKTNGYASKQCGEFLFPKSLAYEAEALQLAELCAYQEFFKEGNNMFVSWSLWLQIQPRPEHWHAYEMFFYSKYETLITKFKREQADKKRREALALAQEQAAAEAKKTAAGVAAEIE